MHTRTKGRIDIQSFSKQEPKKKISKTLTVESIVGTVYQL